MFDGTVDIESHSLEMAEKIAWRSLRFTRCNGAVGINKGNEFHKQVKDWELPREGKLRLIIHNPCESDVDAK